MDLIQYEINQLKIKINTLDSEIKQLTQLKEKAYNNSETCRKIALGATCGGAVCHFIGCFIHPIVIASSLIAMLLTTMPSGLMMLKYQEKKETLEKQIQLCEEEIEKSKFRIEELSENFASLAMRKINSNQTKRV